jgi:hypothetical protein
MHRSMVILFSLAVAASASVAIGCSSSTSGGDGGGGSGSSGGGCANTTVSFKTDIIPIMQNSCSLTSVCHGTMNYAMAEDLYLGPNLANQPSGDTASDITTAYGNIVNVVAKESTLKFVVPGDLANSYLWQKINGDPNAVPAVQASCVSAEAANACTDCSTTTPCGAQMPYLSEPLTSDQLCTFQNWITQGAMNN